MDHKRCTIDGTRAFDHIAFVIDQDKIGRFDFSECHPEWIHPEILGVFRVAHRDVARDALGEAELTEEPEPGGELLLTLLSLGVDRVKHRRLRQSASGGGGTSDGG
jgi:hypothetical protein